MPPSGFRTSPNRVAIIRFGAPAFDLILIGLLGIWLWGGVTIGDHLYLRHGADPRRAAILIGTLGYFLFPILRRKSKVLRQCLNFGKALTEERYRWGFYLLVSLFGLSLAVVQTLAMRTTLYDVGIFHQIMWSLTNGLGFNSTISGAGNFLNDHFSPSLALLAPFFWMSGSSPLFLSGVQALCIFGGAAAWIFLASRVPGVPEIFRKRLAAGTTIFVLGFDSLWGNLRWGFHENALAFFTLSWAIALILSEDPLTNRLKDYPRKAIAFFLFVIAAFSKEILLLDVALAFLVWAFIDWRMARKSWDAKRQAFAFVLVIAAVAFFWEFLQFEKMAHPPDKNYFNRYYSYLGNDLNTFIKTLFLSPFSIVRAVGSKELIKYFWTVLSPWLFLPLLVGVSGRRFPLPWPLLWLGVILPSFASAALATYPPLRGAQFHYVLELWPVLASLTLLTLSRYRSKRLIWAWAILALVRMDHDPINDFREYWKESKQVETARAQLLNIPESAAIVADELAGPWVSGRKSITRWPDLSMLPNHCPDYIVVKYSEKGTLTELGVRAITERCESMTHEMRRNADLVAPVPLWRSGNWSAYHVNFETVPNKSVSKRNHR